MLTSIQNMPTNNFNKSLVTGINYLSKSRGVNPETIFQRVEKDMFRFAKGEFREMKVSSVRVDRRSGDVIMKAEVDGQMKTFINPSTGHAIGIGGDWLPMAQTSGSGINTSVGLTTKERAACEVTSDDASAWDILCSFF